jgi:type I restriction enzyme, R subunit
VIRKASGETLDLKAYEADMCHLIDTYIEAKEPRKISPFDDIPLLDLIVKTGIAKAIDDLPQGTKADRTAVAETIENNVRSKIVKESLSDPAYYAKMSVLLDEIIAARKQRAIEYEDYLQKIAVLAKQVTAGQSADLPAQINTPGLRSLYNNLLPNTSVADNITAEADGAYVTTKNASIIDLALKIDQTVKYVRLDDWRGNQAKEQQIKAAATAFCLETI